RLFNRPPAPLISARTRDAHDDFAGRLLSAPAARRTDPIRARLREAMTDIEIAEVPRCRGGRAVAEIDQHVAKEVVPRRRARPDHDDERLAGHDRTARRTD